MPGPTEVLVVGAGPTGLVLAIWLTRLGVRVRIIDKAPAPSTTSRALAVQARTLELYRQVGLDRELLAESVEVPAIGMWSGGTRVARVDFAGAGRGLSPYPTPVVCPQDAHERVLTAHLRALGVEIERGVALARFVDQGEHVDATLATPTGEEHLTVAFLAGCDGARSLVRQALGIGFPGGTYSKYFYVADVVAGGPAVNGDLAVVLDEAEFLIVFPLRDPARVRLVGVARPDGGDARPDITFADVSHRVLDQLRLDVRSVNWFSTYHVHHRVADHFRAGRAFLLGDAGHIHSPVGGQGMNTGIADAVNLAWKLAAVLRHGARPALLETYETERIAFARRLVATTDRVFTMVTRSGRLAAFVRTRLVPRVIPLVLAIHVVRRFFFRTISQLAFGYRHSALSEGRAGAVHGGDRLPWIELPDGDNFAPLTSLAWQAHVYGEAGTELRDACGTLGLALHVFPWVPDAARAGLARDALYVVRPDGYVGLADPAASVATLRAFVERWRPAVAR